MQTRRQWKRSALVAVILGIGLLGGGTEVWAKSALMQAEITACLDSNGYFFQAPAGRPCPGSSLTWNQQGRPAGPQGSQGPQGPQCPQGLKARPGARPAVLRSGSET